MKVIIDDGKETIVPDVPRVAQNENQPVAAQTKPEFNYPNPAASKVIDESKDKITKKLAAQEVYDVLVTVRNLCLGFIVAVLVIALLWGIPQVVALGVAFAATIIIIWRNQGRMKYMEEKYGLKPNKIKLDGLMYHQTKEKKNNSTHE